MTQSLKRSLKLYLLMCLILTPCIWWFWPNIKVECSLLILRFVDEPRYKSDITLLSINTFRDEVPDEYIEKCYSRAAGLLSTKSTSVKGYAWMDRFGYYRYNTVNQGSKGFIEVRIMENNDSLSLIIRFRKGLFKLP